MNTNFWGNAMWKALHSITFAYPIKPTQQDKENYKNFFTNLKYVLPCEYCRNSYSTFLKCLNIDDYLDNRQLLTYWLYLIHDCVNKKLGKQSISYDEVVELYEKNYPKKSCNS